MMRSASILRTALVLLAGTAGLVRGQTTTPTFPFQILVSTNTSSQLLQNGGQIQFSAAIGQTQTATVVAKYTGNGQVVVSQAPQQFGSPSFTETLSGPQPLQMLPYTLNPGDTITLSIVFAPSSAQEVAAEIIQNFQETAPSSAGGTLQTTQNSINLNLVGTAPSFVFSYTIPATTGNATQVQPGGTIQFPPTLINTSVQGLFTITDNGTAPGNLISITPPAAGSAFQLQGVPLLPGTLSTTQPLSLGILYTPSGKGTDTGQIQVTYGTGSGTTVTFNLSGTSSASTYTYTVIQSGVTNTQVTPNGTITLPPTNVGGTSSVIVQVTNSGSANGTVNSLSLNGAGFSITGTPPLFPESLAPNASFTFTVTFMPTQPGPATGELAVGSDVFSLSGQGLGPQLGFSYVNAAGTTIPVSTTNPSMGFPPIQVTQSEQLMVVVTNTGTSPATVSNISIGESPSPFSVSGLPPLPTTISPNGTIQFNVNFAPTTVAFIQGTLHIDTNVITLSGTGTTPPPLPSYKFTGASGNVAPQTQPEIGLTLSAPYPVDLAGVLTLTTSGNLPTDPAVQFSTGSSTGNRTVDFVIPANTTSANFAGQGSEIFLQTGTVAETITLTPSFETEAGAVPLTPTAPPVAQLVVSPAAPTIVAVQVTSVSANGFALVVTGYTTTRTLTSLNVTFTAATGFTLPQTQFSMPLTQLAPLWFQSTSAASFGGQFAITMPFSLQGTVSTTQTLSQAIASVSVNVSNELGASNSLQASVQ